MSFIGMLKNFAWQKVLGVNIFTVKRKKLTKRS